MLQILLKIISDIEKNYKNIILDMVLSTSNYLKNHLTNCEAYVKVLNAIINEFLHFIITLNDNLLIFNLQSNQ